MDMNQVINAVKRRAESICQILFYIAAGFCFFYYVGNFNGAFMPVLGTFLSMVLEVALWLLIPVLLSIRRRSVAKWAFLGLSIFWALTTIFDLLQQTGLATPGAGSLSAATGVFCFLIACAMIVMSVFAAIAYWKKDTKLKLIAFAIYLCTLIFFLVLFSLRTALNANWNAAWNEYFYLIYGYILIPFAMGFAALAFWLKENELHFSFFDRSESLKGDDRDAYVEEDEDDAEEAPAEETAEEEKAEDENE